MPEIYDEDGKFRILFCAFLAVLFTLTTGSLKSLLVSQTIGINH
jgi:hypothetical protein